jgi:Domain of unknown function (DUF4249)
MRQNLFHTCCFVCLLIALTVRCKQTYAPPAITASNNYLVVDGFINTGSNAVTTIHLTRTRNLNDTTVAGIPELNAQVSILQAGASGISYPLTDPANTGIYSSAALNLDISQQYSIAITTSDGQRYSSDPVPCAQTPPIDSVFWRQPSDFTVYVATHDPTNKTHYYRWDFSETWQHNSQLSTVWTVVDNMIVTTDSTNQRDECWSTDSSANVLTASSAALSQDVVTAFPLLTIPNGDPRMEIGYSILVRQYALTEDAYNYWQLIQKTSENLGTLFDIQPTQLIGNLHCLTNPSQPVIGFMTACTSQQLRIFVDISQLNNWPHNSPGFGCDTLEITPNPVNPLIYNYPDTNYAPWYFITFGPLVLGSKICLDCTLLGGTNIRPPFWPQ